MLGKFLLIKTLTIAGFVVMLLHVLFFVATLALHAQFLAPRLGKIMKRNSSRDACC